MNGVLIDKITREILQRGTYPRYDGEPIEDMDPGLEWLIDYIPYPEESYDYDPRYFKINRSEDTSASLGDHPDYPGVGQFLITFQLIKNTEEEILLALESAKNLANSSVMPYDVQLENITISIGALYKMANGIKLEPHETEILEKTLTYANKITSNYFVAKDKEVLIKSGDPKVDTPSLDTDWIKS